MEMTKEAKQTNTRQGEEGDQQGIVQEIKIWQHYQMVNTQTWIPFKKWDV